MLRRLEKGSEMKFLGEVVSLEGEIRSGIGRVSGDTDCYGPQVEMTLPYNFPLPNQGFYPLWPSLQGVLLGWIQSFSNATFHLARLFSCYQEFRMRLYMVMVSTKNDAPAPHFQGQVSARC
jgi:hypothetical protein